MNSLVQSILSTQEQSQSTQSPIIVTPPGYPYPCNNSALNIDYEAQPTQPESSCLSDVLPQENIIDRILVKVSCRRTKTEKNFLLNDVEDDIATLRDLKLYCRRKLPIKEVVNVGYVMKGRLKICLKTDTELRDFLVTKLRKGKGSLWLECIITNESDSEDECKVDKTFSIKTPSKKRTKTFMDERRERVQSLFTELQQKHGKTYSHPQYRLWAEAYVSGGHNSTESPPRGSMFHVGTEVHSAGSDTTQISCSAKASVTVSPLKRPDCTHGTSLTPRSAASLKSTYIKQIKELHELLEIKAISESDYKTQRDVIIQMMNEL